MQCGAACLSMICKYYGLDYSIDYISSLCPATSEGVSLYGINRTATSLGFNVVCARDTIKHLHDATLPAILHWNQNHFVVLYKIKSNRYYIADPQKGKIKYSHTDFVNNWISNSVSGCDKGIVMYLSPSNEMTCNKKDRSNSSGIKISFLLSYINKYRSFFIQIIIGLLLGCLLQLLFPFLTQSIVDIGIKNKDIGFIWLILIGELMIVLGRTATDFVRRWLLMHITMRINISLLSDFFIKLLKLPMSFFDSKLTGDIIQRMNDHGRIQSFLTNEVLNVSFNTLSFLIFGAVLLKYNYTIFIIYICGSIMYGCWISIFMRKRRILDYELFDLQTKNQDKTIQLVTSIQEIKLQDCEDRQRWIWEDTQADLFSVQMKSLKLQQTQEAGAVFINEIKDIIITILAATSVINGQISLGAMLAIQYIIGQLNSPIEKFMSFIYSLQDVKISLERINEIHKHPNEVNAETIVHEFKSTKSITISHLSFKYDIYALNNTLEDINIQIPAGKVTAIVGPSGSGKSTLIKLMLGYYPITMGSINIAGNNINTYNPKWWRQHCGVVMQDGVIFAETIGRNIAVNNEAIDVQRLERSAKIANIHSFIMNLPLKYETRIGRNGLGLSQGQKQRILIARAVYKNPDFIFLDEATNSLDAENEKTIVKNLDPFYKGKTVVIVAHRLSTVKNADNIIVLDKGKVVESGNHDCLINMQGTYYNLIKNQLELGN